MCNKELPLVSIITPCYNGKKWISKCIKAVLSQSYDNLQYIIVNDGSTDGSEEVIKKCVEENNIKNFNVKYIYQDNQGLAGAIMTGLQNVDGDYFCWCCADDYYSEDYVKNVIDVFVKDSNLGIVSCDTNVVSDENYTIIKTLSFSNKLKNGNIFKDCLLCENDFHFCGAMFKTSFFDRINPKREIYKSREGQSWQVMLPMYYYYNVGYVDMPLYNFMYRNDSISNVANNSNAKDCIVQNGEYMKIIFNTLDTIDMPTKERKKYKKCVQKKYENIAASLYVHSTDKAMISNIMAENGMKKRLGKIFVRQIKKTIKNFLINN